VLLRVTPPIPRALHGAFDQFQPFVVGGSARRWRQRQQLPQALVADYRDDGLPARSAGVAIRSRVLRVGGHQSLLHCENEVVRGMQRGGREWRGGAAEKKL